VLGWNITFSILVSACAVTLYVALGGLRSAIFNEVLQFVLIWAGALLVPILGLMQTGGWTGLKARIIATFNPPACTLPRTVMFTYGATQAILRPTRWVSTGRASSSD